MTWLLERYGSPAAPRKAGRRRLVEVIRPNAQRMAQRLIDDVFDALDEQTVVVPGTGTLDVVLPPLARSLAVIHEQRRALEAQIEAHPPFAVLTSIPGERTNCSDWLCSLTIADRFANWNQWVRPLPFTLACMALLVFLVVPGAGRLWKTLDTKALHTAATH